MTELRKNKEKVQGEVMRDLVRRQAINHYFVENPPKPVAPERLSEFLAAFPPWLQSAFDSAFAGRSAAAADGRLPARLSARPKSSWCSGHVTGRRGTSCHERAGRVRRDRGQAAVPSRQSSVVSRGMAGGAIRLRKKKTSAGCGLRWPRPSKAGAGSSPTRWSARSS